MVITDDKRALWRRMAELAKPAHLDGEPIIALLDENRTLRECVAELEAATESTNIRLREIYYEVSGCSPVLAQGNESSALLEWLRDVILKQKTHVVELEASERQLRGYCVDYRKAVRGLEKENGRHIGQMVAISKGCEGGSVDVAEGHFDWSPQLDLVRYLSGMVVELEAAQKPRPMSEASEDGTEVGLVVPIHWGDDQEWHDRDGTIMNADVKCLDGTLWAFGWVPCLLDWEKKNGKH